MSLTKLVKRPDSPPSWISICTNAINTLKRKLITTSILIPPDWDKDFYIYVVASIMTIGLVLSQKDDK